MSGLIDKDYLDTETNVYAEILSGDTSIIYEAYTCTDPDTKEDNGYLLYLNGEKISDPSFRIKIYTENADQSLYLVLDQECSLE